VNKQALSERDRCTVFITPPRVQARREVQIEMRGEVNLSKGNVIGFRRIHRRREARRTDYEPRYKPNLPLAIGEGEDNHGVNGVRLRRL